MTVEGSTTRAVELVHRVTHEAASAKGKNFLDLFSNYLAQTRYNHYVELVEPDVGRACIRCCQNPSDCPLTRDTAGCPAVIPGTYGC